VGAAADVASGGSLTPALIAAGLSMAGTAVGSYAQAQQLRKQDEITAQGITAQTQLQKQGEAAVSDTTKNFQDSTAAVQQKSAQQLGAYTQALQQANGISTSANPNVPGASKAYGAEKAAAGSSAADYVNAIAQSAATTEGTQLERINEGQQEAQTATTLGDLSRQSQEQNYVTQLKVRATQANPWLTSLGMLLQGAGTAYGIASGWKAGGTGITPNDLGTATSASQSGFGFNGAGSIIGDPNAGASNANGIFSAINPTNSNRYTLTGNAFGGG
jgi:hypothetical protein